MADSDLGCVRYIHRENRFLRQSQKTLSHRQYASGIFGLAFIFPTSISLYGYDMGIG